MGNQDSLAIYMILGAGIPLIAGLVFFVHELGHYFVARLCGVRVERFEVGVGPEIHSWTGWGGTRWSVRLYPLCGMVHLAHEMEDNTHKKGTFGAAPLWQRIMITLSGPLVSLFFAVLLFFMFYTAVGQPSTPPIVTGVEVGSHAEEAGFEPGDKILSVEGKPIRRYEEARRIFRNKIDKPLSVLFERSGQFFETDVVSSAVQYFDKLGFLQSHGRTGLTAGQTPFRLTAVESVDGQDTKDKPDLARTLLLARMGGEAVAGLKSDDGKVRKYMVNLDASLNRDMADPLSEDYNRVYLGILPGDVYLHQNAGEALVAAAGETLRIVSSVFHVTANMIGADSRVLAPEVQVSPELGAFRSHLYSLLHITAFVSVCIGLINLLPIPGFDGCLILLLTAEGAVGQEKAGKLRARLIVTGCLVIYALVVFSNIDNLKQALMR